MNEQPPTLGKYKAAVETFAASALRELLQRYASGERSFAIEKHFNRASVRTDVFHRQIDPRWFQNLFYRIVEWEVVGLPEVSAYADFLIIPDPMDGIDGFVIPECNTMVYRLSVE